MHAFNSSSLLSSLTRLCSSLYRCCSLCLCAHLARRVAAALALITAVLGVAATALMSADANHKDGQCNATQSTATVRPLLLAGDG